ncbi:MAG: carbohydrate ABC transporter permease [Clostridiales bacterium]|nr:carbohydrate ABC transporter permease [Clostridiales bacterium]
MVESRKFYSYYLPKIIIWSILGFICVVMLYPFLNVLAQSFSSNTPIAEGNVFLIPKGFTLNGYKFLMSYKLLFQSLFNTIFYTVSGTLINVILTLFGAFAITRKHLIWRKGFSVFIMLTLWFNAGIIPNFLTVSSYNLIDNRLAMILPWAIMTYNLVVLRSFIQKVPQSLEEAAQIDGANDFQILFKVVIPLIIPGIATIAMYYAVRHWNDYIPALFYLRSKEKYPLQMVMRELVVLVNLQDIGAAGNGSQAVRYASIIFATVPILALFPFIHRKFVSGIMTGAIKE